MGIVDALRDAGFQAEEVKESAFVIEGIYKCTFVAAEKMEDKGYGESLYGQFKINEVLKGRESKSKFPEFKQYFALKEDEVGNKKRGLAKLINGLFSVGVEIDTTSDEVLMSGITDALGTDVYINAFKAKKFKKEGDEFSEIEGEFKQGWNFMTEKDAIKKAGIKTADASSESVPF